jgi:hypothetical protein
MWAAVGFPHFFFRSENRRVFLGFRAAMGSYLASFVRFSISVSGHFLAECLETHEIFAGATIQALGLGLAAEEEVGAGGGFRRRVPES